MGIGVNVTSHPPDDQVQYPATSLHAEGAPGENARSMLGRFCSAFLSRYEEWRDHGFVPIRLAWLERADKLHGPIEIRLDGTCGDDALSAATACGIFADLDSSGALILQQGEFRRLILAGDVMPGSSERMPSG
jgi:BirA family biotin operon repressor/biotin-[acetyl-CoA-carboxylase] ligase